MSKLDKVIETGIFVGKEIAKDDKITEFLFGTYADGSKRNLSDAIHGEYLSPKQKKKIEKKKKKKKTVKFKL